ncbi:MAG: tandem-95 repeat protein [Gemmataceae bacterium]|nr:tandem-95 repeat protein [Gemmataceae bacterium]
MKSRSYRPSFESLEARDVPAAWYVATTGSDAAAGTLAAPFRTPQRAAAVANPGDTINLRAGTYGGQVTIRDADVTIRSYPGEAARVSAPITDSGVGMAIWSTARGTQVLDLEVSGGYYYAIKFDAAGGRIEGSKVHDSGRDVIKISPGADDVVIRANEIYRSGRRDSSNAEGIDNVNADRMLVQDNYIHDIATAGVYAKGGATGVVIERNRVRTALIGIQLGGSTDLAWFDTVANPDLYENIDGTVRNNVVQGITYAGLGMIAALRPQVYNNTVVDVARTAQGAILFDGMAHGSRMTRTVDPTVVNNVITQAAASTRPAVVVRANGGAGTLTLGNNRYHDAGGAAQFRDERGGVWVGGLAAWQARSGEAGSTEGNPTLTADGHLAAGSPCVDAGRAVAGLTDDMDGDSRAAAVDIGADEVPAATRAAVDDAAATAEDTRVTIAVLANDVGGPTAVVSAARPAHGSVAVNPDGTVTYTPGRNFNGTDTFTYTIDDGVGGSSTATVTVTVAAVNDLPTGVRDTIVTTRNVPAAVNVLANDSDVDGDALTVTGVSGGSHGTMVYLPTGLVTYTPAAGYVGTDWFYYTLSDGRGGTRLVRVDVTVNA